MESATKRFAHPTEQELAGHVQVLVLEVGQLDAIHPQETLITASCAILSDSKDGRWYASIS